MIATDLQNLYPRIRKAVSALGHRPRIMQMCGTQTHTICREGLHRLLGNSINLVPGPCCPVCSISPGDVERMLALPRRHNVIIAASGNMLHVPGIESSLAQEQEKGADIRTVNSPLDALTLAQRIQSEEIVCVVAGFETAIPAVVSAIREAETREIDNFSVLLLVKLSLPAMGAAMKSRAGIEAFLTSSLLAEAIGRDACREFAEQNGVPMLSTGTEPADIVTGLTLLVEMLAKGQAQYADLPDASAGNDNVSVDTQGLIAQLCRTVDAEWLGFGMIPDSGLRLTEEYDRFDALRKFGVPDPPRADDPHYSSHGCLCGKIIQGLASPSDCPLIGLSCTPETPIGPCIASPAGPCAAKFHYA